MIAHLGEHKYYVCHYIEAQEIVRQGGVITKFHKILQFRQEAFARDYVIFNVNRRIEAKNKNDEFGKEFFKLMNNSCYGQMMMNERDFKMGKFCRGRKKGISQKKLALSNPRCVDWYDLDNETYFVLFDQMNTITKPLACGVSVLGISKSYMISFWYKLLDKFGPDSIHLIFTDTDSLIFELSGNNYKEAYIFSYIREDPNFAEWFDLYDVPNVRREAQLIMLIGH